MDSKSVGFIHKKYFNEYKKRRNLKLLLWSYFRKYELVNFAHAKILFYWPTSVLPQNTVTIQSRKNKNGLVELGRSLWKYAIHSSE